jgi:hypothetical protein
MTWEVEQQQREEGRQQVVWSEMAESCGAGPALASCVCACARARVWGETPKPGMISIPLIFVFGTFNGFEVGWLGATTIFGSPVPNQQSIIFSATLVPWLLFSSQPSHKKRPLRL